MNLSRNSKSRWIGAMVWLGAGLPVFAGTPAIPFSNTFTYVAGTTVHSLTNEGWDASDPSVQVQTNVVYTDASAVILPPNTSLTNWWQSAAMTNVWTDFYVQMMPRNYTNDAVATSNAVIDIVLDGSGYFQVYDHQNGWLTLSNTASGAPINAYTNGQWGRVTLFQNYSNYQCAVFLDGTLIKELLPFVSNVTASSRFQVVGDATLNSYFDNYSITRAIPAGLSNAAEIDAYGYLALTNYVGPSQVYTTIQSAVAAALPRYTISVANGTYNENVVISNALAGIIGGGFTITGSLAIAPGLAITVGGALSVGGTMNIATTATLVANGQVIGHDVLVNGGLVLGSGGGLTATNLTLGSAVMMAITNATVVVSNLSIGAGAQLVVSNGTVTANGLTLTGSFALDANWGNATASAELPYQENFDIYQSGLPLNALGFRGWGASDSSVAVGQSQYFSASNGVGIGYNKTVSNRVNAAAAQVWTDFRLIPAYDVNDNTTVVNLAAAFMAAMTTNGYLSLYNRTNATWEECRQDVWHNPLARQTGQWSRVSVLCDYNTKQCAIFLDGALVRQKLPFINPDLSSNSTLMVVNGEPNSAYLDNVYLGATYPATLTNDVNANGIPDAKELLMKGDIFSSGSIFKFR